MISESDKKQVKESFKKFTSVFHRTNKDNCKTSIGPTVKENLQGIDKGEIFKNKLKDLFKKDKKPTSTCPNPENNSPGSGSEDKKKLKESCKKFATFFQTENRDFFETGTESTVDSYMPVARKRDVLKNDFKNLFRKQKKPYFPAPCSEYDSSAPVTLTTGDMVSRHSELKVRKRDIFKNKFKSLFNLKKDSKEAEQVNQEGSFVLEPDCEPMCDPQYEIEYARAYAYVYGDEVRAPKTNIYSKNVLPSMAEKTFRDLNESVQFDSSSTYSDSKIIEDNITTPLSVSNYNNNINLISLKLENQDLSFVYDANYKDPFFNVTWSPEIKESKIKNGIKKIISHVKNTFLSFGVSIILQLNTF